MRRPETQKFRISGEILLERAFARAFLCCFVICMGSFSSVFGPLVSRVPLAPFIPVSSLEPVVEQTSPCRAILINLACAPTLSHALSISPGSGRGKSSATIESSSFPLPFTNLSTAFQAEIPNSPFSSLQVF